MRKPTVSQIISEGDRGS